jgi:hypothetical protein
MASGRPRKGVVAAEFDDHHARLMLLQQRRQARTPARGRVAADAGVDHLPGQPFTRQTLFQQGHPAGPARQSVFGRQAVAQHQQARP